MVTWNDILQDHTTAVRETAEALRALIHDTLPDMAEKAYPGWHGIGFWHPKAGYVCGVFPRDEVARLMFQKGHQLGDPNNVFTGSGSYTRHIDVATAADIPEDAIQDLLLQAVSL